MKKKSINFADGVLGRPFAADVNFAFAAIWDLSCGKTTIDISKGNIIVVANHYQSMSIGFITEDGAVWDDIFKELNEEGVIDLSVNSININQLAVDLFNIAA
jgi:hypothetical protein